MPRIDDIKETFKKKEYRAWDNNLLETLKIPKNNLEEENHSSSQKIVPENEPVEKNPIESGLDQDSNSVQLGFNQGSIRVQSGFNQGSNRVQLESNQGSIGVQSGFNQGSIRVQNLPANRVQLGCNETPDQIEKLIRNLGGNEEKILFYVVDICIEKTSLSTGEVSGKNIMSMVGTTRNGMETALKRLRKKGLIFREKGKTGKHGMINLSITEEIKNEAIKAIRVNQIEHELINQGSIRVQNLPANRVQLGFSAEPYSSSKRYNKNTTTALPDEWKKINFIPLESIGFSEQHLVDIYETNLCEASVVQESIYHFAFGVEEGKYKSYDSPLKVFIGRLRKGNPWFESNYEPPKEKALRELLERKKAEKEKRDFMIKEIIDIEFPLWRKKLTEEEKKQIVPPEILRVNLAPAVTSALRTYYLDKILLPKLEADSGLIVNS